MDLYDLIIHELEVKKSLAALIYLIERGRELEFTVNGMEYFLSRDHAAKYVSLWNKHHEQSFDSIEELIEMQSWETGFSYLFGILSKLKLFFSVR